MRKKNQFK